MEFLCRLLFILVCGENEKALLITDKVSSSNCWACFFRWGQTKGNERAGKNGGGEGVMLGEFKVYSAVL